MWRVIGIGMVGLLLLGILLSAFAQQSPAVGAKDLFIQGLLRQSRRTQTAASSAARTIDARQNPKTDAGEKQRNPAIAESDESAGLRYQVEWQVRDGEPWRLVSPDSVFRSGERIRLRFESTAPGYILLLQIAPSGRVSLLFPDVQKGMPDNKMSAGVSRLLPRSDAWFAFDSHVGVERLFVLFAPTEEELKAIVPDTERAAPMEESDLLARLTPIRGAKDLVLQTVNDVSEDAGVYAVRTNGRPLTLEVRLKHE
jgi:hypothetical protein